MTRYLFLKGEVIYKGCHYDINKHRSTYLDLCSDLRCFFVCWTDSTLIHFLCLTNEVLNVYMTRYLFLKGEVIYMGCHYDINKHRSTYLDLCSDLRCFFVCWTDPTLIHFFVPDEWGFKCLYDTLFVFER